MPVPISQDVRKLLAFGSGIGIEIGETNLEVTAARVRPTGIRVPGHLTIPSYAERPAAEWGAEYAAFVKSMGMTHLSATVLLPRREVVVRQLMLPGVAPRDRAGAIRFQLDTLHPYGDQEVCWGWSNVGENAVLIGIARKLVVDRYAALFTEAGIAVTSFTFSAAAFHAAIRLNGFAGQGFVALRRTAAGAVEVYGESPARPVFSAEFDLEPGRAAALALAELRLPPETEPRNLEEVLPKPDHNPVENDLSRNALPYATALAGACPRLAPSVNVLPVEYRRSNSRAFVIPTVVLGVLLVGALVGLSVSPRIADSRYLAKLQKEIAQVEPRARRAADLDRQIDSARARARLLDQLRGQTRADMDALQELTKVLAPPAWTNSIGLTRDGVRISGEAPQAAPLLQQLDASPLFQNSEFSLIGKGNGTETFQLRTAREKRP